MKHPVNFIYSNVVWCYLHQQSYKWNCNLFCCLTIKTDYSSITLAKVKVNSLCMPRRHMGEHWYSSTH